MLEASKKLARGRGRETTDHPWKRRPYNPTPERVEEVFQRVLRSDRENSTTVP